MGWPLSAAGESASAPAEQRIQPSANTDIDRKRVASPPRDTRQLLPTGQGARVTPARLSPQGMQAATTPHQEKGCSSGRVHSAPAGTR